jgi:hypothetical protein
MWGGGVEVTLQSGSDMNKPISAELIGSFFHLMQNMQSIPDWLKIGWIRKYIA